MWRGWSSGRRSRRAEMGDVILELLYDFPLQAKLATSSIPTLALNPGA